MKENIKKIILGEGLGLIKFGMLRTDVLDILGEPSEKETFFNIEEEEEEGRSESWHYDDLELSMNFDEEDDWRLVLFSVNADFYTLMEDITIGIDMKTVKSKLTDIEDLEFEDWSNAENPNHKLISSEDKGFNLWFENDLLSEIQWSPIYADDNTICWPES